MSSKLKDVKSPSGSVSSVRFSSEKEGDSKIPKGSEILSTDHTVNVEEIENGFIICRNTNTKYMAPGKEYNDYAYETKKWYSETNPLTINTDNKELADMFD